MRLYRAVSQAEFDDIITSGAFRQDPDGFAFGKWFAVLREDAAAWGRWFALHDGLRYYVIETEVNDTLFRQLTVLENLDNIGAAIFLTENQFSTLPIFSTQVN